MTTWQATTARIAGFGIGVLALTAVPIDAAQRSFNASYVVQTVIDRADGTLVATELLTIAAVNGRAVVTVTQQRTGERAATTAPIDGHGIIAVATTDPALVCYNNAQGIVANGSRTQPAGSLTMTLAGSSFDVPINVANIAGAGDIQDFTIGGSVEGAFAALPEQNVAIVIDGDVRTQHDQLASVQLRETTVMTATHAAVGQTTCTIARVIDAPAGAPA